MKYSLEKYKFIKHNDNIIAISTYAGKTVKGVAKLHPDDSFNEEKGKKLAAARCNLKISKRRFARAQKKVAEAEKAYQREIAWYNKMVDYYNDSYAAIKEAEAEIESLKNDM